MLLGLMRGMQKLFKRKKKILIFKQLRIENLERRTQKNKKWED
jgi:hypothetical protein